MFHYQHATAEHLAAITERLSGRRVKPCGCVYYGLRNMSPCDEHEAEYREPEDAGYHYVGPMTAGRGL